MHVHVAGWFKFWKTAAEMISERIRVVVGKQKTKYDAICIGWVSAAET